MGYHISFGGLPFHARQPPLLSPVITDESRSSIKQILYSHSTFVTLMLKKVNPFSLSFIVTFLSLPFFCSEIHPFPNPLLFPPGTIQILSKQIQSLDLHSPDCTGHSHFHFSMVPAYRHFHHHAEYELHVLLFHGSLL